MKKGANIEARKSSCIGIVITTITYKGTIVKANKKSFIAEFKSMTKTFGRKTEIDDPNYNATAKFTFWKTTSDGRNIYTNPLYGLVTL